MTKFSLWVGPELYLSAKDIFKRRIVPKRDLISSCDPLFKFVTRSYLLIE